MSTELKLKTNVGDAVIERINSLCEAGFAMPKDYQFVNAIKMSLLKIQDLKDKNGNSALEVCTSVSVQTALFQMACKGLSAALNQCYFIVRGNTLCMSESYFGKVLMVKRIYPDWEPVPVVIREGDVFEYSINPKNGKRFIVRHEQSLENIDKGFVGGYMYLPNGELFIMTKKQIMTAWSKSSSREQAVHKTFDEKMVGKTLVNSGCTMVINSTPTYQIGIDEETEIIEQRMPSAEIEDVDFVEEISEEQNSAEKSDEQPKQVQNASNVAKLEDDDF